MEKEIAKRLIEIRDIIDFIDDGYHNKDIRNLIKIGNELFLRLSPYNQKKFQEWLEKKEMGFNKPSSFLFAKIATCIVRINFIFKEDYIYGDDV